MTLTVRSKRLTRVSRCRVDLVEARYSYWSVANELSRNALTYVTHVAHGKAGCPPANNTEPNNSEVYRNPTLVRGLRVAERTVCYSTP